VPEAVGGVDGFEGAKEGAGGGGRAVLDGVGDGDVESGARRGGVLRGREFDAGEGREEGRKFAREVVVGGGEVLEGVR